MARLALDGAGPNGRVQTAPGLATATGIAEPTVAKVLKILGQAGLVEGVRGARGGYRLTRPLPAVPLAEVIAAVDGPIALTACVAGTLGTCEGEGVRGPGGGEGVGAARGGGARVNKPTRTALTGIPLAARAAPCLRPAPRAPPPYPSIAAV